MKMLKNRLYQIELNKPDREEGGMLEQIRRPASEARFHYVFFTVHDCDDHRTSLNIPDVQKVMAARSILHRGIPEADDNVTAGDAA